jgi:hypothetical protein
MFVKSLSSFSCLLLLLLGETWSGRFVDNGGSGEGVVESFCPDLEGEDELVMFRDLEREEDWNDEGDYKA